MRTNPTKTAAIISTIGIDIGHLVGAYKLGAIVDAHWGCARCAITELALFRPRIT